MQENLAESTAPDASEIIISAEEKAFISEVVALNATGIVLRKSALSVRMFSMGGNRTVVAYILQESSDGYTVALPAILTTSKEGAVGAEFISPVPLVKLFKTSISMMALPTPTIFFHYLKTTQSRHATLPGYFNEDRVTQASSLLAQMSVAIEGRALEVSAALNESESSSDVGAAFIEQIQKSGNFYVDDRNNNKYRH